MTIGEAAAGDGEEPLHLVDGPIGHDAGRRQAGGPALGEEVDDRVGQGRVGRDPGEEPLEPLRRVRLLELDELGQERLVALLLPQNGTRSTRRSSSRDLAARR